MMGFVKLSVPLLLTGAIAALVGCGGGGGSSNSNVSSTGTLNLAITDAPIDDANAVVVEFSGVSIKPRNGSAQDFTFETVKSIDLLTLQGSAYDSLISNEVVPAGDYEWIRLAVNAEEDGILDSYIELTDGTQIELRVPSGSQSGLKLVSGFTVPAGGVANFTIDFDLRKSIVMPGSGGAMLKPALRLMNNVSVGTIAGTVDAAIISAKCADPLETGAVYLFSGANATVVDVQGVAGDPLTTALVSDTQTAGIYAYEIGFVEAGEYTLAYSCDAAIDDPEAADTLDFFAAVNIIVDVDQLTEQNFTL